MSASASGADAGGAARNRDHNQGNQARSYTVEQKAAVVRIRRCSPTAFYEILGLEEVKKTCTESEIKKAYRKQSLLTHPDKNGHEHADEAFKMVSRAFGVLGDKEKRDKFDRFGTDPDSRFGQAQAQSPFSGFAQRRPGAAAGGGWDQEMTPEEMFQRFFGGGGGGFGGPFGGFDTGPQFVFNFGGGPGFNVHQFGGARPRRRPAAQGQQQDNSGGLSTLISLLPILLLFFFPLLGSLFGDGSSAAATPKMAFDTPEPPFVLERQTPRLKVPYYVNPNDVQSWTDRELGQLDRTAESDFIRKMRNQCHREVAHQQRLYEAASGWLFQDQDKLRTASEYQKLSCRRLQKLGVPP